jgi:uncharacterized membrane protein
MSKVQKITFSAMIIALYVSVLYFTQSFSFGAYQIRIATSLYALSYLFSFLVFPLGLANFIANTLFGGMGLLDMIGGGLVGVLTSFLVLCIRKRGWNRWLIAVPIILVPGLGVASWLSYLLNLPYKAMAVSLCIGQIIPGICGVCLVNVLERVWKPGKNTEIQEQNV